MQNIWNHQWIKKWIEKFPKIYFMFLLYLRKDICIVENVGIPGNK